MLKYTHDFKYNIQNVLMMTKVIVIEIITKRPFHFPVSGRKIPTGNIFHQLYVLTKGNKSSQLVH